MKGLYTHLYLSFLSCFICLVGCADLRMFLGAFSSGSPDSDAGLNPG